MLWTASWEGHISTGEIAAIASLFFAVLNPFVKLPIFLNLAAPYPKAQKRSMAVTVAVAVVIALSLVIWFGLELLELLEVSVEALQVAGGSLIIAIGFSMVLGEGHKEPSAEDFLEGEASADESWRTKAVVPLAIPLIVGGGAISIVATVTAEFNNTGDKLTINLIALGMSLLLLVVLFFADEVQQVLRPSGVEILTRVFGLVVLSLGWTIFLGGLVVFLPGLTI